MKPGDTVRSGAGVPYHFKSDHRDRTRVKSQWVASLPDELVLFEDGYPRNRGNSFWHLRKTPNGLLHLGFSARIHGAQRDLHLAIFRGNPDWHGYPADPENNKQDKPPSSVIRAWYDEGTLLKRQWKRLSRGKDAWAR